MILQLLSHKLAPIENTALQVQNIGAPFPKDDTIEKQSLPCNFTMDALKDDIQVPLNDVVVAVPIGTFGFFWLIFIR